MARKDRNPSRAARRTSQLAAAGRVKVPGTVDVCIVGGGPAGLAAAIAVAQRGARAVVIEKDLECGRTILATGNGRCNFANTELDPALYNDPEFVEHVCGTMWLNDVLRFFDACGLAWAEEAEGRLYPLSRQAASVRNILLHQARSLGVVLAPAREVVELVKHKDAFEVTWNEGFGNQQVGRLQARAVIVATGGLARLSLEQLGLEAAPASPILCPLSCTGPALGQLDGRRVRASATLMRQQQTIATESGEVLFRSYGLSGIAVFNLSRLAQPGDKIVLDLLPALSANKACALAHGTLDGILDPVVAQELMHVTSDHAATIRLAKALTYHVEGTADQSHAQVQRGGLVTSRFDPHTLEAKGLPGFFACGEALNIDGPCGGYNLAWAWKSGLVAGRAAARRAFND